MLLVVRIHWLSLKYSLVGRAHAFEAGLSNP